jgi:hypothetical protein
MAAGYGVSMRVLLFSLICAGLAAGLAPGNGWADPAEHGYTKFVDTPQIVDSYPLQVSSWSVRDDGRMLELHFTAGTPECFGVHANVLETADTVEVRLRSGARPEAVARACIMIAVNGSLDVPLAEPVGTREVLTPL